MFEPDAFIADCQAALAADKSHKCVREVLARAVSDPSAVLKGLGEPKRAAVQKLHHSGSLTILNRAASGTRRPWKNVATTWPGI